MFDRPVSRTEHCCWVCSAPTQVTNNTVLGFIRYHSELIFVLLECLIKTDLRDKSERCCAHRLPTPAALQQHTWWLFLLFSPELLQDMGKGEWGNRLSAIALLSDYLDFFTPYSFTINKLWAYTASWPPVHNYFHLQNQIFIFFSDLLFGLSSSSQLHHPEFFLSCLQNSYYHFGNRVIFPNALAQRLRFIYSLSNQ